MPTAWTVARGLARMSRPDHLLLVAVVYTVGTAMAVGRGQQLDSGTYLIGLAALLPVAASIHYTNEYADYETDRLTERTPYSGGSGALVTFPLPRRLPLLAAIVALPLGFAIALGGVVVGLPRIAIGVLLVGAVFGWAYSLPPLALAWRGLGEIDNALLGGTVLPGYGFVVQTGWIDLTTVVAVAPFTMLVFLNLLDTTWPDRRADAAVGKRTLATRWTPTRLRALYGLVAVAAAVSLLPVASVARPVALASVVGLPFVAWGWMRYTRCRSPFPTVAAMVVVAAAQLLAWSWLAWGS